MGVCVLLTIIALETRRGTQNTQYALIQSLKCVT
uniref:Uncharacterized protein n=1 Tax=Anguilla anguilla TaxID=7936 RepID=A0A0E9VPS1_ANGAN